VKNGHGHDEDYGDSRDLHEYVDFGARCHTAETHKKLDEFVQTTGDAPDMRVPGTYRIQYHCEDAKGFSVSKYRDVVVTGRIVVKCPFVVVHGLDRSSPQFTRMGLYKFQRYFKGSPIYKQILLPPPKATKPKTPNYIYPVRAKPGTGDSSYWLMDQTHKVEPEHKGLQVLSTAPTPDQISKDTKKSGKGFNLLLHGVGQWREWVADTGDWEPAPKVRVVCAPKIMQLESGMSNVKVAHHHTQQ
jgi:hypothetical protein